MKPSALVTGANGFIGRHLCSYLKERGVKVRALVRSLPIQTSGKDSVWDEIVACRLGDEPIAEEVVDGIDTIYHLAGVVHAFQPEKEMEQAYWSVNRDATEELLVKACSAEVKSFVYFSSVKAMADPGEQCVDESWEELPIDIYGRSKREAENIVLGAGLDNNIHVCNLRPSLVYGPGVKGNMLKMVKAVKSGRFPPLPDVGNRRSLVHVYDLIIAACLAAENPDANGKTYIVTDGRLYSTRQMYEWICMHTGKKIPAWNIPLSVLRGLAFIGDLMGKVRGERFIIDSESSSKLTGSACYISEKIEQELGFKPQRNLQDSIAEMAQSLSASD